MADCPDVYADVFRISISNFSVAITFSLTQPTEETGPQTPQQIPTTVVARLRMSPALAQDLVRVLTATMAQHATQVVVPPGGITN